ncbi:MAG: hypothetical protein KTR25_05195 [Myxococcales bacterium]|nr:hypothetical protein [Myxococcales bacterium]
MISSVPHALSACIMSADGIAVDIVNHEDSIAATLSNLRASSPAGGASQRVPPPRSRSIVERFGVEATQLFVEYGTLVEQFRSTAQMFAAGELEEIAARTELYTCLMRPINHEFFLALVLLPEGCLGRGRFLLRVLAPQIEPKLS